MYKLLALGVDNLIHCCNINDKKRSCCSKNMPIRQVNPDFKKLKDITWCYECDDLLEESEIQN